MATMAMVACFFGSVRVALKQSAERYMALVVDW
jgi:hypothetical protein